MIMLTVTKPRRKLKKLLKGGALLLLLGVVVPGIYYSLQTVGAMSLFVAEDETAQVEQSTPAEPAEPQAQTGSEETMAADSGAENDNAGEEENNEEQIDETQVNAEQAAAADTAENPAEDSAGELTAEQKGGGLWAALQAVLFGEKAQVIPYAPGS